MSAHMKKHRTKKTATKGKSSKAKLMYMVYGNKTYAIPSNIAEKYVLRKNIKNLRFSDSIPADEVFADLDKKYTKAGALLKGLRAREGLSQLQFAAKIGINQSNLSNMENGRRPIGKIIAKRIAKIFDVDYRYFIE